VISLFHVHKCKFMLCVALLVARVLSIFKFMVILFYMIFVLLVVEDNKRLNFLEENNHHDMRDHIDINSRSRRYDLHSKSFLILREYTF